MRECREDELTMTLIQIQKVSPRRTHSQKLAIINDRQSDPWFGVQIEQHDDVCIVSKPSVGALSVLNNEELVVFHLYQENLAELDAAHDSIGLFLTQLGYKNEEVRLTTETYLSRFERDGWLRSSPPANDSKPLTSIYFTVTRACDLACPYCYQGLSNRNGTEMLVAEAEIALDRIKAVNPDCLVVVTGGEPFNHSSIFEILDHVEARGFRFSILSNGTYIDEEKAERLHAYQGLQSIQLSIDGITESTHAMTRGKGHLEKVMRAFDSLVRHGLPFSVAPTMHNGNLHELYDIAVLTMKNGGWFTPNNLRQFPHKGLDFSLIRLSNDKCLDTLRDINRRLIGTFGFEYIAKIKAKHSAPDVCSETIPNSRFICGMAHSLMDLDWNGDLYPCHLTKDKSLILGNLFKEDFDIVFGRIMDRKIRVRSHEIPKCSGCHFVSTCGGGCRAGAWFGNGSLAREDDLCDLNYESSLRQVLGEAKGLPA